MNLHVRDGAVIAKAFLSEVFLHNHSAALLPPAVAATEIMIATVINY